MTDRLADDRYRPRVLGPVYTEHQRQRCDDASDTAPILSDSIDNGANQSSVASIIAALPLTFSVNRTLLTTDLLLWKQHRLNSKIYKTQIQ